MTTRILVTGGAGFIGSHYVRTLLGPWGPGDIDITVLDALTYAGNPANLDAVRDQPGFTFVKGDICDADLVATLMAEHDDVVHFAAESHVDRSIDDGAVFVHSNVTGTHTLVDAAQRVGVRTFVQVSTDEVYGSVDKGSRTETDPLKPTSPYAASKAASDLLALAHHRTHGLDVRVTRCSNNFGAHQHPEKLIPRSVSRLLSGANMLLYGDGSQVRDWLHIDDHVHAIELVRTRGRAGGIYNIGGSAELSNAELAGLLLKSCGADWGRVVYVTDRKGHDNRYSVNCTKITDELGYRPRRDFRAALEETVQWYRDHPDWWEPLTERATGWPQESQPFCLQAAERS